MPIGICVSYLEKRLLIPSAHFLIILFVLFDIELHEFFIHTPTEVTMGYILNLLSGITFANIFYSVGCIFVSLVYFTVQKPFSLT